LATSHHCIDKKVGKGFAHGQRGGDDYVEDVPMKPDASTSQSGDGPGKSDQTPGSRGTGEDSQKKGAGPKNATILHNREFRAAVGTKGKR